MKAILLQFTIVLLLLSCSKDNNTVQVNTSGNLTYDGKMYPLDKGYLHHDLDRRFIVSLFSSGIAVNTEGGALYLDGRGNGVILTLDSGTPTGLSSATYKWPDQTTPDSEMIADAQMGITREGVTSINGTFRNATYGTGTIVVSQSNQQYTIEFSILVDGKTATGKYIGTLANY